MNERSIFMEALAQETPEQRSAYLEEACGGDRALRQRVEALLASDEQAGSFLGKPVLERLAEKLGTPERPQETQGEAPAAEDGSAPSNDEVNRPGPIEGLGSRIGPYKLLQEIGEGGMGAVYLAEQSQPVRRMVALKIIKPGMDSRQVIARFEAERQALALMDHPNIARVLDAGTTESGRPYFVMELVKGVPITKFCDERRLTLRQRLELFGPVCQAVQHAHQKGVIHRDLKPSNVMVCLYDGKPVPKVIDFGIAKATGQKLTERTMFTEIGQVVGTLEYMSPEQAELNQLDIDTRSDIYSLGVLLYELLTGSTPLERKRLKSAAILEVLRLIREEEPPKPSTRLSTTDEMPSVAANRGLEPRKLSGLVRGELDWIVMKALEKDRNRRYETANGFALDVQRFLADEPVLACPPSAWYRLRKLSRRNKGPVLATTLIVLALVGGIIGTTIGMVRAKRAREKQESLRQLAEDNEHTAKFNEQKASNAAAKEKKAKEMAQQRETQTRVVLGFFLNNIVGAARPERQVGGLGRDATVRKALEASLPFVEKDFTDQPVIEAQLRMTIGLSFAYLGDAKIAADQYQAARAAVLETPRLRASLDTGEYGESSQSMGSPRPPRRCSQALPGSAGDTESHIRADHPDTLQLMGKLANCYVLLNRHADALKVREETLARQKAKLGAGHPSTLITMNNLASSYRAAGRNDEAHKLHEQVLVARQGKLGADHPDTLLSMSNLACTYDALGRYTDALKLYQQTLPRQKAKLGPMHRETLLTMERLAEHYWARKRYADAARIYEDMLKQQKAALGADHLDALKSMNNVASSYAKLGRYADALKLRDELLPLYKVKFGANHPTTLGSMWATADLLVKLDRGAEAVPIIDECVRGATGQPVHPRLIASVLELRLKHFAKAKDASSCRQTAEMWETQKRSDALSLYDAACMRAVTAAVVKQDPKTPIADAARRHKRSRPGDGLAGASDHRGLSGRGVDGERHRPRRPARPGGLQEAARRTGGESQEVAPGSMNQVGRCGPYRQTSPEPARPRPCARSAHPSDGHSGNPWRDSAPDSALEIREAATDERSLVLAA